MKKRDLSDIELREILSELLPLVRMDHVLPPDNDILNQAIRRGLVSTPPSHMIGDERENLRVNAWIRGSKSNGLFVRPRLFMPYYEEVKVLLEDQLVQETEMMRLRRARYMQDIPDTLYMVEDKPRAHGTVGVDVLAAVLPVPDGATMTAMLKREQKLRQSPSCQRAIALELSSRREINRQIRLRVVHEFNLPDPVADMLENSTCFCLEEPITNEGDEFITNEADTIVHPSPTKAVSSIGLPACYSRNYTFPRQGQYLNVGASIDVFSQRYELPAIITEGDTFRFNEPESSSCSDGHLSDIMPDVAMATASIGQLQLHEQEMELDLGDGAAHLHGPTVTTNPHARHTHAHSHQHLLNPPLLGPVSTHHQSLSHSGYHRFLAGPGPPSYSVNRLPDSNSYHNGTPRFL